MVCRNRRDTTLGAIERVKRQTSDAAITIALFDDASTDGTIEAIAAHYPEIQVVHGDGEAFWNGGLHQLWSAKRTAAVDAFLWLNDDSWLDDDALTRLIATWRVQQTKQRDRRLILVGATRDADGAVSYSGYDAVRSPFAFRLERVEPDATVAKPVSTFNGNIVLIGRGVVDAIGLNDPKFFHNLGDIDYGLRARHAGVPIFLLPGTLASCESNTAKFQGGYGSPHLSVMAQWRKVNSHHGLPFRSWWHFTRRHSGSFWPLHFLIPYRHLVKFWNIVPKRSPPGA